uniref:ANK_REP_REGION domain-containing protein n=1 Tax=Macrostomum lignano TaxID=282301 RepID=A0A1I8FJY2_9PLAT
TRRSCPPNWSIMSDSAHSMSISQTDNTGATALMLAADAGQHRTHSQLIRSRRLTARSRHSRLALLCHEPASLVTCEQPRLSSTNMEPMPAIGDSQGLTCAQLASDMSSGQGAAVAESHAERWTTRGRTPSKAGSCIDCSVDAGFTRAESRVCQQGWLTGWKESLESSHQDGRHR